MRSSSSASVSCGWKGDTFLARGRKYIYSTFREGSLLTRINCRRFLKSFDLRKNYFETIYLHIYFSRPVNTSPERRVLINFIIPSISFNSCLLPSRFHVTEKNRFLARDRKYTPLSRRYTSLMHQLYLCVVNISQEPSLSSPFFL